MTADIAIAVGVGGLLDGRHGREEPVDVGVLAIAIRVVVQLYARAFRPAQHFDERCLLRRCCGFLA